MTQNINVLDALKLIKSGEAILIDVREPDEFKTEHIAYALSIPLSSLEDNLKMLDIPEDKILMFQCLKGSRGQMACEHVESATAFKNNTVNIQGGIEAWKTQKLPVISKNTTSPQISIFRQVQIIAGFLIALSVLLGFTGFTASFIFAGIIGAALFIAGLTGWCGLALVLANMPWNK